MKYALYLNFKTYIKRAYFRIEKLLITYLNYVILYKKLPLF